MEFNFIFIVFMLCVKQIAKERHEKIGIAVKSISHKTQQKLFRLHQSAYCHIQVTISLFTEEMEVKTHILDKRKQKSKWKSSGATCRWVEEDRSKYKHNEIWKPFTLSFSCFFLWCGSGIFRHTTLIFKWNENKSKENISHRYLFP